VAVGDRGVDRAAVVPDDRLDARALTVGHLPHQARVPRVRDRARAVREGGGARPHARLDPVGRVLVPGRAVRTPGYTERVAGGCPAHGRLRPRGHRAARPEQHDAQDRRRGPRGSSRPFRHDRHCFLPIS
jgi:hypothetical protein